MTNDTMQPQNSALVLTSGLTAMMVFLFVIAGLQPAFGRNPKSYKETTLYTFTGGSDGSSPYAGLIRDSKGNFYGVTFAGGTHNLGTVFKVDRAGTETVIYSFSGKPDGEHPSADLLMDKSGNLYGTNYEGGANGYGAVFKVDTAGTESLLYSFQSGSDGEYPGSSLIEDSAGNLYGTTGYGGTSGDGTVFELSAPNYTETILHNFTGADGANPFAPLLRDSAGDFYSTTSNGGQSNNGTIFKLSKKGKLTVLHSFAAGKDGQNPYAGLVRDKRGNFYGTTYSGGAGCYGFGCGTVFKLTPRNKETILHAFGASDGHYPDFGNLYLDAKGTLYGTTYAGGTDDMGTVFEVNSRTGAETVVYNFTGGTDEGFPVAGLISDKAGNLYSTTLGDGSSTFGTVFKLKP